MFFPFKKPKQEEKTYYDAAIDLSKLNEIVAIERINDITVISFIEDGEKEWSEMNLHCSPKVHQDIVDEFKLMLME